jgi:hypothetical protein
MFGRSKPVVFDPYRGRRSRAGVPRWVLLVLLGAATGAAGVIYVQQEWLPPRLSAADSDALRLAYQQADADRKRLQAELSVASEGLKQAQAAVGRLTEETAAASEEVGALRAGLAVAVDALPPDPREGAVAVRAGRFTAKGGQLAYNVVLSRDRAGAKPMDGVLQLTVSGASANAPDASVALKPVALSIGQHAVAHGSLPLPAGFRPRQATVRVLDKPDGRQLGMRILLVD